MQVNKNGSLTESEVFYYATVNMIPLKFEPTWASNTGNYLLRWFTEDGILFAKGARSGQLTLCNEFRKLNPNGDK